MYKYFIEKAGDKRVLNIECEGSPKATTLADPTFFNYVFDLVSKENPDLISVNKAYKYIYSEEDVNELKDLLEKTQQIRKEDFKVKYCPICSKKAKETFSKIEEGIKSNPVKAYFNIVAEVSKSPPLCRTCSPSFIIDLNELKDSLEKNLLIKNALNYGEGKEAYLRTFIPSAIPSFISSYIDLKIPKGSKQIESYNVGASKVKIYELAKRPEKLYFLNAPEFSLHKNENDILHEILDEISKEESRIINPKEARKHFKSLGYNLLYEHRKELDDKELRNLSDIIARYSAGYGIIEALLSDDKIQDVFMDSPGGSPIYIYHEDHEECITNIIPTDFELEKLAARFRALSGRPFDESSPVLHTELTDLGVRVCGLCPPATFSGIGFAFRRHKPTPWTLTQFIKAGMMDPQTAGLLSFLVDGQRSMLITGSRSSGKTSLLSACMAEISPNFRVIVIEDTPELPIESLKERGYKIQHLRTQPSLGSSTELSYELTAEEALRTALRLGESVLVLGEVRGPEAKVLFEAMRVGAAGNVVMGTIHGSSAYDTWDRIVNDLDVPTTSFKATDIVVSTASLRKADEIRRYRRLTSITEVRKHWKEDPSLEKGFFDITSYNQAKDKWKLNLEASEVIKKVAKTKNMKVKDAIENIKCRGKIKEMLVEYSKKKPGLLEIGPTVDANNQYFALAKKQIDKKGSVNYKELLKDFENWLKKYAKH